MKIDEFISDLKKRRDISGFCHHEVLEPAKALYGEPSGGVAGSIRDALASKGVKGLYSHQARAIDLIRAGRNVVTMTPTASGKSLIYNIPVLESLLADPDSRALYVFPLKGLEQDQLKAFLSLSDATCIEGPGRLGAAEIYDGDTTAYRRKKIRETPPPVVLTNPDMLHLAICAFHQKWEAFLKNLKYVIIDEIHTYRGVLGSNVAQVLRRFRRICQKHGADPQFIASSATIANPKELAQTLTGLDFEVVSESGAPMGRKNFVFINPIPEMSPYTVATKVFTDAIRNDFKTIAFTKARKTTELMHTWVSESAPDISGRISSYRAGFLPSERREIEERLFSGKLDGVVTTSALELGVDIGGLDVCILVGYPGTVSSTWQRAGRVGRSGRDSLIILIAMADALDQYFMHNPPDFFGRSVEAAVLDTTNEAILKVHLPLAAAELPIKADESSYDMSAVEPVLKKLEAEGALRLWVKGDMWYPRKRRLHRDVSIREAGSQYRIKTTDGTLLGQSGTHRLFHELHPGAAYLHRGAQYIVKSVNTTAREVRVKDAANPGYYTQPITDEETEIIKEETRKKVGTFEISTGVLRITEQVLGYRKKDLHTREEMGEFLLDLPAQVFTTTGIWMAVDETIENEMEEAGYAMAGAVHALEHAAIATLPLYALCDRMDLGGVSYSFNPDLRGPAVFIYDAVEGGVGLSRRGFDVVEDWFRSTIKLMKECECEVSCPSCTQDQKCGNNNEPLDKRGALLILKRWLGED